MPKESSLEEGRARREHWERVYGAKAEDEVSWFQAHPRISLELIARTGVSREARIVDVGGGASRLADALLEAGYANLAVLDIAEGALAKARRRLGERAARITWIAADVTSWEPAAPLDLWHDRAVFHFMVRPEDRLAYRDTMLRALRGGGHAILGTFASDGPDRCSGLPVQRYEPDTLALELGEGFRLVEGVHEEHATPSGKVQRFQFSRFVRLDGASRAASVRS
jgi:SAM-dependent methyltransferase